MEAASRPGRTIVEFIGVAGVGKSTICRFARDEFLRAGVPAQDSRQVLDHIRNDGLVPWIVTRLGHQSKTEKRLKRRFKRIRGQALQSFYQRYPESEELLEARLTRMHADSPAEAELVRPWVTSQMADFELMSQSRGDSSICLWEEGIAQRCVNLFALVAEAGSPDGIERFVTQWPLPDALVHVRAGLDTAFARMEQRGRTKRLRDASQEEVRRFLDRSERVVNVIAAEARRRGIPVFTLDNDERRDPVTPSLEGWADCATGLTQLARE